MHTPQLQPNRAISHAKLVVERGMYSDTVRLSLFRLYAARTASSYAKWTTGPSYVMTTTPDSDDEACTFCHQNNPLSGTDQSERPLKDGQCKEALHFLCQRSLCTSEPILSKSPGLPLRLFCSLLFESNDGL